MKKLLPLLFLFAISKNQAQDCVDRVTCSDDSVTLYLLNGSKFSWGFNMHGQLGNGTTASQTSPAPWDPLESTCRHASLSIL